MPVECIGFVRNVRRAIRDQLLFAITAGVAPDATSGIYIQNRARRVIGTVKPAARLTIPSSNVAAIIHGTASSTTNIPVANADI